MNAESPEIENSAEEENQLDPNEPYPVVINPLHFILLCIATMGFYAIWWQYKCWVYFKEKEKSNILPALWALSFVFVAIPVIPLLNKIADYCKIYSHRVMYNSIIMWLACFGINYSAGLAMKGEHEVIGVILSILTFVPLIPAVMEFNFYFTGNRFGYKKDPFNTRQLFLLGLGVIYWACVIQLILAGNFHPLNPFQLK